MGQLQNAPALKRLRRDMLAGLRPKSCAPCRELDRNGAWSLRTWANETFARERSRLPQTLPDGALAAPRLRYLSISFSNSCNFRCRVCGPSWSTSWREDLALYARQNSWPDPPPTVLRPTDDPARFLQELGKCLNDVEAIHFIGGEPLREPAHYILLKRLIERGLFHIRLSYSTNLSALECGEWSAPKMWSRFKAVQVIASLDGAGRRGEYLRKGQDWARTVSLRERIARESPNVEFGVSVVVSVHNALHLTDFLEDWLGRGYVSASSVGFNILRDPPYYSVQALPPRFKRRVAEKLAQSRDRLRALDPTGRVSGLLKGVEFFMLERDLSRRLSEFRKVTRRLDALRGEDFRAAFPEMAELLD